VAEENSIRTEGEEHLYVDQIGRTRGFLVGEGRDEEILLLPRSDLDRRKKTRGSK
jgi:hypothetical protein